MTAWSKTWGTALALSGCLGLLGPIAIAVPAHATEINAEEPAPLTETTWELMSFRTAGSELAAAIASEQRASLRLEPEPRLQGNTGCNSFFGSYQLDPSRQQLSLSPVGSTLRACLSEALTQQEQALLAGLPQVATYQVEGDRLQLSDTNQQVLFTFRVQPKVAFSQTEWILQSYNNGKEALVTPIAETTLTAQFDANTQRLSGSTDCNRYFAAYQVHNQYLKIRAIGSTRRACFGDRATQEKAFLQLLSDTRSYQIEGNRLELYNADRQLLAVFNAKANSDITN